MEPARVLAVAGLSAGALAYEILLVRAFAVAHFHHFAYMAIGVAMLGFGAAGTWLAIAGSRPPAARARGFALSALLAAAALVASPVIALRVPLDPTRLAWDGGQWPRLVALYLVLALPFVLGALAQLLALSLAPDRPGAIYGAGFLGAGLGAGAGLAVLWVVTPERALALPAVLAGAGALAAQTGAAGRPAARALGAAILLAAVGVALAPPWRIVPTPYKGLPQVEAYPDARRVAEGTSPVGWVVAVAAPAFRYAPGLSLAYRGAVPPQIGLFLDGELAGAVMDRVSAPAARALLDGLPSAMPYALARRDRVLVIGAGGGTEVWNAVAHGAGEVTAVELSPDLARLAVALGGASDGARVRWITGDARGYVARTDDAFDLVTIGAGGAFAATIAGVHGLSEDFLHTVEAYAACLARLRPGGVLAITRWVTAPPRESVRVILTAAAALRRAGGVPPGDALVVARSWGTTTTLVRPDGFTAPEVATLRAWAAERQFDLDWYPGLAAPVAGFHALAEPVLFDAARAAATGEDAAARFAAKYPFAVAPVNDARPYPHHHVRLRSFGRLLGAERGAWLPFAEWGVVALAATLAQSVVVAAALLALPAVLRRGVPVASGGRVVAYFAAIGFAYLAAEIAVIQQLGLLLGHPVYAVAAVLAVMLVGSGVGSAWSDRLPAVRARLAGAALAAALLLYAAVLLGLVHGLEGRATWIRAAAALPLLLPLAFVMGMPFPLGVRRLLTGGAGLPLAWAANGFASVVAAPLAALVALELGSPTLLVAGAAAYGAAALAAPGGPVAR